MYPGWGECRHARDGFACEPRMRESSAPMKLAFPLKPCALAVLLFCAVGSSAALTLGRARGAALLGQPLEMQVPVTLAADEDGSGLCFSADVYYGETRQEGSRVAVKAELNAAGQPSQLRISSKSPIDEPVVSVVVRAACGATTSRRYVLLADVISELAPALPNLVGTTVPRPAAPAGMAEAGAGRPGNESPTPRASAPVAAPVRQAQAQARKAASQQTVPAVPPRAGHKSRLKLAPLDVSQDWEPALKSSSELLAPSVDDTERRLAASAVWKSLNVTPEEMVRDAVRLQDLERNVAKLSELAAQNQRQTQTLIARLESSEAQRYSNPLVYALIAAVLALGGALVWMWRRLGKLSDAPWWNAQSPIEGVPVRDTRAGDGASSAPKAGDDATAGQATLPPVPEPKPLAIAPVSSVMRMGSGDLDLNLDDVPPMPVPPVAVAPAVLATAERRAAPRDFSGSMSAPLRAINTQEVLDVQQQAEFFMTLGQYDDAISLLEAHIAENPRSNPLVYLDLLKALHTLSRKVTFDHYRNAFNSVFTGQVPVYTQFNQAGEGLEAYPALCKEIESLWPTPAVIDCIESYLVRDPVGATDSRLDLEAFRDLLLLHAIAGRLGADHPSGVMPFSAVKNLNTLAPADTGTVPVDAVLPVPGSADDTAGGLDLDLSDLDAPAAPPAPNLIDFDASGLSLAPREDGSRS